MYDKYYYSCNIDLLGFLKTKERRFITYAHLWRVCKEDTKKEFIYLDEITPSFEKRFRIVIVLNKRLTEKEIREEKFSNKIYNILIKGNEELEEIKKIRNELSEIINKMEELRND